MWTPEKQTAYLAKWTNSVGASNFALFDALDPAIFFVVSGLSGDVDWTTFPDPAGKYPYEERNGYGEPELTPVFRVSRLVNPVALYERHGRVLGEVYKMVAAENWTVGNGIAEAAKLAFLQATGRDLVELHGTGDGLTAKVGRA